MSIRHRRGRRSGAWLGLLAVAIQIFLPFVIAAEIRAMAAEELVLADAFDPATTCLHDVSGQPRGDHRAPLHGAVSGCPICVALAAAHAFAPPAAPLQALPHVVESDLVTAAIAPRTASILAAPYQSRAPPPSA